MEFKIRLFTAVILWTGFNVVCCSIAGDICPRNNGTWRVDRKDDEYRCILSCSNGYVPSDCHVIRPLTGGGYNKPVPFCKNAPPILSGYTLFKVVVGIAAVAFLQYVLTVLGFETLGIAASLIAAWLQGPLTAAGMVAGTHVGIIGLVYMAIDYVINIVKGCEHE